MEKWFEQFMAILESIELELKGEFSFLNFWISPKNADPEAKPQYAFAMDEKNQNKEVDYDMPPENKKSFVLPKITKKMKEEIYNAAKENRLYIKPDIQSRPMWGDLCYFNVGADDTCIITPELNVLGEDAVKGGKDYETFGFSKETFAAELKKNGLYEKYPLPHDVIEAHPEDILSLPIMQEYARIMREAPDFIRSSIIDDDTKTSGTIESLEAFKEKKYARMNKDEKKYIDGRIASEKFYSILRGNPTTGVTQPAVEKNNVVKLEHIHQTEYQSTSNGCYSASMALLLQSRGLNLDQKLIRASRGDADIKLNSDAEQKMRITGNNKGNIFAMSGIVANSLKNSLVCERSYLNGLKTLNPADKARELADIKRNILDALEKHHSPVSLLMEGHYRTIVGYDKNTDTLLVKDSWGYGHLKSSVDTDKKIKLSELGNTKKLSLTFLADIDPKEPFKNFGNMKEVINKLEYVDDQIITRDDPFGTASLDMGLKGSRAVETRYFSNATSVQISYTFPNKITIPEKLKQQKFSSPKILPLKESKEKQALFETLEKRQKELIPDNMELILDGNQEEIEKRDFKSAKFNTITRNEDGSVERKDLSMSDFITYRALDVIKENIDIMTPAQVQQALSGQPLNESFIDSVKNSFVRAKNFGQAMSHKFGTPISGKNLSSVAYTYSWLSKNLGSLEKMDDQELFRTAEKFKNGRTVDEMSIGDQMAMNKYISLLDERGMDTSSLAISSGAASLQTEFDSLNGADGPEQGAGPELQQSGAANHILPNNMSSLWMNADLNQNAKNMAQWYETELPKAGFPADIVAMAQYTAKNIALNAQNKPNESLDKNQFKKGLVCMEMIHFAVEDRMKKIAAAEGKTPRVEDALFHFKGEKGKTEKILFSPSASDYIGAIGTYKTFSDVSKSLAESPEWAADFVKNQRAYMKDIARSASFDVERAKRKNHKERKAVQEKAKAEKQKKQTAEAVQANGPK